MSLRVSLRALAARRGLLGLTEDVAVEHADGVLTLRRGDLTVVLNCGTVDVPLPAGDLVASSGPVDGEVLPPDTAVWLR